MMSKTAVSILALGFAASAAMPAYADNLGAGATGGLRADQDSVVPAPAGDPTRLGPLQDKYTGGAIDLDTGISAEAETGADDDALSTGSIGAEGGLEGDAGADLGKEADETAQ
ncbi:granule-bound starch synthase I [Tepidicaulis marinus]|uniref:Granule-bound starch synthase I n=1 Tax=Tepidicaulis marinus TaxID=1333998 RepID=A0A081BC29_9HYPH|nr:hypothetical protein [Tepidicaulis marinus]GAK45597.1 granule-bound starch synthase I [Tepidicaulis marinus]